MEKLKKIRQSKNLTLKDVCTQTGITSATVLSRYETGEREPDFATLKKLANFYKVSLDYLLECSPEWTEEEIAQGVGNHPVPLEQEELYWLNLLNRVKDKLGEKYLSAVLQMLEMTLQNK